MLKLNWLAILHQRLLVGLDNKNDILGVAYNKGELHGKNGPNDTTGQCWYGFALMAKNVYTSYGEMPDFGTLRALIEEDLSNSPQQQED